MSDRPSGQPIQRKDQILGCRYVECRVSLTIVQRLSFQRALGFIICLSNSLVTLTVFMPWQVKAPYGVHRGLEEKNMTYTYMLVTLIGYALKLSSLLCMYDTQLESANNYHNAKMVGSRI